MNAISSLSLNEGEWEKFPIFRPNDAPQSTYFNHYELTTGQENSLNMAKMDYLDLENAELLRENEELMEHIRIRDAELNTLRREYKHSLEYIEDLHGKLMRNVQAMALQKMEIENFKVERLVYLEDGVGKANTMQNERAKGLVDVVDVALVEPSLKRIEEFRRKSSQLLEDKVESVVPRGLLAAENRRSIRASRGDGNVGMHQRNTSSEAVSVMNKEMRILRAAIVAKESEIRHLNTELKKYKTRRKLAALGDESPTSRRESQSTLSTETHKQEELLQEIHLQMEEKIRWQSYAEKLLRLIIHRSPQLLHVEELSSVLPPASDTENEEKLLEAHWEDFAFSLLQKVIRKAPQVITEEDFCVFEKLTEEQQRVKAAFQSQCTVPEMDPNITGKRNATISSAVQTKSTKKWLPCFRRKRKTTTLKTPKTSKSLENIHASSSDAVFHTSSQLSFV